MRSRFNHDGTLDHHADNEHDLFRRADEALARQRQLDYAATVAGQSATGIVSSLPTSVVASPLRATQSAAGTLAPAMPHEELAERFGVKIPSSPNRAWPIRTQSASGAAQITRERRA